MSFLIKNSTADDDDRFSNKTVAVPYNSPRSLIASAATINFADKRELEAINRRRATDKWQEEAWDYYDLITEIKFAANIIANVLSRINIFAGYVTDSALVPSRISEVQSLDDDLKEKAQSFLFLLETGNGGTAGLMRTAALSLFVAGECYLVKEPAKFSSGEPEKWQIRSIDEIVTTTGRRATVAIKPRRDSTPSDYIPLPANGYISRIWRPHPRYQDEADSSVRGVLELCDELLLLSRTAKAVTKSRLNAGLLYIPDGLSNVTEADGYSGSSVDDLADGAGDSFEEELIDAMITPISDETSATSVVPLIVRGPGDLGKQINFIKFERSFDPQLLQRSKDILDRILSGLDIPKDLSAAMSGLKLTRQTPVVEESFYNAHVEPLMLMIVDALTVGFLRPALRSIGFPEEQVLRTVVWYDPSKVTTKPSKDVTSNKGYELQVLSGKAWRSANGYSESDAPTELEIAQRLAVAKGLLSEPITEKLLSTLIPDLMSSLRQQELQEQAPDSTNTLNKIMSNTPDHDAENKPQEKSTNAPAAPGSLAEPDKPAA
jgi:hypothetical protein